MLILLPTTSLLRTGADVYCLLCCSALLATCDIDYYLERFANDCCSLQALLPTSLICTAAERVNCLLVMLNVAGHCVLKRLATGRWLLRALVHYVRTATDVYCLLSCWTLLVTNAIVY